MRHIKTLIFSVTFFVGLTSSAQTQLDWEQLKNLTYRWQYSAEYETWYEKPLFTTYMKGLEGKQVTVKGFIIPQDKPNNKYFVSLNPNSTCFFCGKAGKETIVQLLLVNQQDFEVDDVVILKGNLKLNLTPFEMPFALENARLVKIISE